jgi:hypothetical protein
VSARSAASSPTAFQRSAGGLDGAVDVLLGRDGGLREALAGGRLGELAELAGRRLRRLAVDEQPVFTLGRDRHQARKIPVLPPLS